MSAEPRHGEKPPGFESEYDAELQPSWVSLTCGGLALFIALLGQAGPTRGAIAWVDLPLTLVLFVIDAALVARSEQRAAGGMMGLLLAAFAVAVAAAGLVLRRDHPWLG